ncbi:MAG: hypothetical protein F6K35_30625, partial [Okeania sp. SIO2H7]|nr:hypothetical protein [Okeania sp. SIO2H7]
MRFLFQSKPRFAGIFAALAVVVGVATGGGTAETIANQREGRDADEIAQADGG